MTTPCDNSLSYSDQQIFQDPEQDEFHKCKRRRASNFTMMWAPGHSGSQCIVSDKDLEERMVKPWEEYASTLLTSSLQMTLEWRNTGSLYLREMRKDV